METDFLKSQDGSHRQAISLSSLDAAARGAVQQRLRNKVASDCWAVIRTRASMPTAAEMEADLVAASEMFGPIMLQNKQGTRIREVRDIGTKAGQGTSYRYANSRHGGNFHTDGAEIDHPLPDFFALACVRQAPTGGALRIVRLKKLIAGLQDRPVELRTLHEPFAFDRRGDVEPGGGLSVAKAILFREHDKECVTYFRKYIENVETELGGAPLTPLQVAALDAFDELCYTPTLADEYRMAPGEIVIVDNKHAVHDRTTFVDAPNPEDGRLVLRTWISASGPKLQ